VGVELPCFLSPLILPSPPLSAQCSASWRKNLEWGGVLLVYLINKMPQYYKKIKVVSSRIGKNGTQNLKEKLLQKTRPAKKSK